MLLTRIALSVITLSPFLGVFAGHHISRGFNAKPHGDHHGQSSRRAVESGVVTISAARLRLDSCKSETVTGNIPITDPAMGNAFLSCVSDVSNSVAADMGALQPGLATFLVDSNGNKLTNEQAADEILALVESFKSAGSNVKSAANGNTGDMVQMIAVNVEFIQGDLARVASDIAGLPRVVESFKTCLNWLDAMVEDILGSESEDD